MGRKLMKRKELAPQAEHLYVYDLKDFKDIADIVKVNERTLRTWAKRDGWKEKREQFVRSKEAAKFEFMDFTRYLLREVRGSFEAGEEPNKYKVDLLKSFRKTLLPDSEFAPKPEITEEAKELLDPLEAVRQFLGL